MSVRKLALILTVIMLVGGVVSASANEVQRLQLENRILFALNNLAETPEELQELLDLLEEVQTARESSQEQLAELLREQQELLRRGEVEAARELTERIQEVQRESVEAWHRLTEKLKEQVTKKHPAVSKTPEFKDSRLLPQRVWSMTPVLPRVQPRVQSRVQPDVVPRAPVVRQRSLDTDWQWFEGFKDSPTLQRLWPNWGWDQPTILRRSPDHPSVLGPRTGGGRGILRFPTFGSFRAIR
ncbi:MAG TPA: flagellar protein FlgN [Firmicutes bacterium]|nr:flagellar protein FlgN [Bacillota bacterium]